MFQYSWKLLHPTDTHQNPECPQDAEEYERVSRIANLQSMVMSCLSIKLYKESAKPFNIAFYMFYGVNESGFCFTVNTIQLQQWRKVCHCWSYCHDQGATTLDGQNGISFSGRHKETYLCSLTRFRSTWFKRSTQESY